MKTKLIYPTLKRFIAPVAACVIFLTSSVSGQFLWSERIASVGSLPSGEPDVGLVLDGQDNCYVTGFFDGTNDFGGVTLTNQSIGGCDIFVAKYDSGGALKWARRAGGNASVQNTGRGIGVDAAGNVYVTGGFRGPADFGNINLPAANAKNFFLAKYDNAGTTQWVQRANDGNSAYGTGLTVDGNGNSYVLGFVNGDGTLVLGSLNLALPPAEVSFIAKYDATGAAQWAQLMGGSDEVYATKVAIDSSGNVYVRGTFFSTLTIGATNLTVSAGSTENMFVAKFDNSGNLLWVRQAQGGNVDEGGVAVDSSRSVYVTGYFHNTLNFGGISLTNTAPESSTGNAFTAKYDSSGVIQWANQAVGSTGGVFWDAAMDARDNVYTAGFLGGYAVVSKYNSSGALQWSYSASGPPALPDSSTVSKCAVDAAGHCYVAGWYQGTASFGAANLARQGVWNFFLASMTPTDPAVQFTAIPNRGAVPLAVQFSSPAVDSLGHAIASWNWAFGDGATSSLQNPTHTYATVGSFTPSLTATNNNNTAAIGVGPTILVTNSFIQFTATPTNGPPPLTVQFAAPSMDSAGRTITNWSWSFGDGATSGLQNPTHTYTDFANFTPTLAATSSGGAPVLSSGPEIATVTPPNDFLYITNAGTIIINSYVGVGGVVIVPASINGLPVTGVEPFVFLGNKALASITIPGSVATIGEEAFFNCLNLTNVTLNSGLTSIGVDAFAGCDKLTIVTVPNSVINIGVDAFANCSGLTNAIIENGVTSIDGGAFYGCVRLTNVSIPPSVTSIGDSVFDQCSGLTAINVDINNPAYSSQGGVLFDISQASLLEYPPGNAQPSYTVPNTVADIAAGAFGQCLLTNIMLSSSVTNIDDFAFGGSSLVSVTIPGSVLRVGSGAFENCSLLSNVTIQNGVASLGDWAFAGCVIDNVTIPASVKSVGLAPFASNPHLLAITVDPENTSFSSADGILFDHSQTMIIEGPSGLSGHCTLPEGVTSIADSAFYDCESLSAISFPSSLTSIGDNAFQSCGLTSVSVPSAVTNIGWAAFAYCPLGSITILGEPANVQSYAFSYNANLMAIYFWSNAPSVDLSAFLGVESATAYYLAGTTGWTSTFDGFPTVEWNPLIYTATPESGAVPLTVSFAPAAKDYAGHSITGWFWSFGDGSTSVAENPSHTYTQAGAFTPTLTATNNAGQIATGSGPTLITATNAAIFSGLVLNGGFETGDFNGWTLSGYTYALVDDGSILGFTPLGSYQADFETGGSPGYLSQTLSTVAGVNYLLSFWFENPDEDAGQFLVSWNGNTLLDTTNLNADEWTNMQFIVSATRSNTVLQFGFQDDNNALVLDSVDVESNFFQFAATPDRGEPPLNIQFASPSDDSNGHPIISWFWSFGDGAGFSTNQNPLHVYNDMGAFSPSLVATNSLGEAVTGVGASIRVGMDSGLVINGSFETGDFTGWTLSGDDNDAGVDNAEILPFFGDYEALLATGGSTSLLTQDVATIPGAGYAITFHISNPFQDDFRLIVSWNGTTLLDTTNLDADWTGMQFLASATGSTATLEFAFEDDYDFLCLDNVAVTRAEPDITSLGLTPANLLLNATPAVVGETYFIKTSTNLALPPRNWTPIATNTANANGYFTITATNTAIGAAPRQFYIIQALGQ